MRGQKSFVTSDGRRAWLAAEGCDLLRGGMFREQMAMDLQSRQRQATRLSKGETDLVWVVAFLMEGEGREIWRTLI